MTQSRDHNSEVKYSDLSHVFFLKASHTTSPTKTSNAIHIQLYPPQLSCIPPFMPPFGIFCAITTPPMYKESTAMRSDTMSWEPLFRVLTILSLPNINLLGRQSGFRVPRCLGATPAQYSTALRCPAQSLQRVKVKLVPLAEEPPVTIGFRYR